MRQATPELVSMSRAQVLKPEQVARAMVHAYPWLPDIMAVAAVVAAEEGDPEALGHLRADSSGGPGAFVQSCVSHPDSGVSHLLTAPLLRSMTPDQEASGRCPCIMPGCRASCLPACLRTCTASLWPRMSCTSSSRAACTSSALQSSH